MVLNRKKINRPSDVFQVTVEHILVVNRAGEAPFRERLATLLSEDQAARDDVACLVADAHLLTLLDVARGLGVPTLVLRTGSAACLRMFAAFPMLCDKGYQTAQGKYAHALIHDERKCTTLEPTSCMLLSVP